MINDKADEVVEELLETRLNIYQTELETSIIGSDFIFDFVHLLCYECHKISFK